MNAPRMGHQDRTYDARIKRLRDRLEKAVEPGDLTPHNRLAVVLKGVLDVLADMVADQEEAGK